MIRFRNLPVEVRREAIHKAITGPGDPHDLLLDLNEIGDASSIPFLIDVLARLTKPRLPGDDNVRHCVEALQVITNHDAGWSAEGWQEWYDANKEKPQQEWIADGFVQLQFPVSNPIADEFATALIRASSPAYRPEYARKNAVRMLDRLEVDAVARSIEPLLASSVTADRRSAVAALEHLHGQRVADLLRSVIADPDVDVAENALRVLNATLRKSAAPLAPSTLWDLSLARYGVHILYKLSERLVVLGVGYGVDDARVIGFDVVSKRIQWSYSTSSAVRSNAVRYGERLYFISDNRVVHCVSTKGKPIWTRQLTKVPYSTGPHVVATGGQLVIADEGALYLVTRDGLVRERPSQERLGRDLVAGHKRLFGAVFNGPLMVIEPDGASIDRIDTGLKIAHLSTVGEAVCVVSMGPRQQLQCLAQDSLRELWRADLPNESSGYTEVVGGRDTVYVLAQGRALGFRLRDGHRLWASNEFRNSAPWKPFGKLVLTDMWGQLEWRDGQTGELIAITSGPHGLKGTSVIVSGDSLLVETTAIEPHQDGLRLMKLPSFAVTALRQPY